MTLNNFPSSNGTSSLTLWTTILKLIVDGRIIGAGGQGGMGIHADNANGRAGNPGGPALHVQAPITLDVLDADWPAPQAVDAIYCANMIHIAPWACTAGLMQGAARHLAPQGLLLTYGPYLEDDVPTAPSNAAFDADLRARNADWGIRRLADVAAQAAAAGFTLRERVAMPANNLLLAWSRSGA